MLKFNKKGCPFGHPYFITILPLPKNCIKEDFQGLHSSKSRSLLDANEDLESKRNAENTFLGNFYAIP